MAHSRTKESRYYFETLRQEKEAYYVCESGSEQQGTSIRMEGGVIVVACWNEASI